jgi:pyruvate dehydrogenase E1 component alpha subunit
MQMNEWNIESLKSYEAEIAESFNRGEIKFPVHLSDGNEEHLLRIFKNVAESDWVFCSWRSHYQCLLKGVDPKELSDAISRGRSIALSFINYRVFSTAIVGGQLPIAVGMALAIKEKKVEEHVWCFLGDMTSESGIAQSSITFATNFDLPITFIIEDNGKSVLTDTRSTWNSELLRFEKFANSKVISFKYESKYPHAGAGVRVQF